MRCRKSDLLGIKIVANMICCKRKLLQAKVVASESCCKHDYLLQTRCLQPGSMRPTFWAYALSGEDRDKFGAYWKAFDVGANSLAILNFRR
jgi:hypothetical protein